MRPPTACKSPRSPSLSRFLLPRSLSTRFSCNCHPTCGERQDRALDSTRRGLHNCELIQKALAYRYFVWPHIRTSASDESARAQIIRVCVMKLFRNACVSGGEIRASHPLISARSSSGTSKHPSRSLLYHTIAVSTSSSSPCRRCIVASASSAGDHASREHEAKLGPNVISGVKELRDNVVWSQATVRPGLGACMVCPGCMALPPSTGSWPHDPTLRIRPGHLQAIPPLLSWCTSSLPGARIPMRPILPSLP